MKIVSSESGKAFDPQVVEVLARALRRTGADGAGARAHDRASFRPNVKIVTRRGAGGGIRSVQPAPSPDAGQGRRRWTS